MNKIPRKLLSSFCPALMIVLLLSLSGPAHAFEKVRFIRELRTGLQEPIDVAVDEKGFSFVLDRVTARVSIFNEEGEFLRAFGEEGLNLGQMRAPQAIAAGPVGRIIVADTGNNRIQIFNMAGEMLLAFGKMGTLAGQFRSPTAVAVDRFGMIFVADRDNRRIQIFSPNGVFFKAFSTGYRPVDISLDPKRNIYVLLSEVSKVSKYTAQGEKIQDISCVMQGKDYLSRAAALSVDARGDIYVMEHNEQSIKKFDYNENILISFGSEGMGRGQFFNAQGMACNQDGLLFVADTKNSRIQVLEISGTPKSPLPREEKFPLFLDFDSVVSAEQGVTDLFSLPGRGLYMLSAKKHAVLIKNSRGTDAFGQEGLKAGELRNPGALWVTMDGKVFVADTGNDRLQIFEPTGQVNYIWGKKGIKASQFQEPQGVAVNKRGMIYVSDTRNRRVQVFNYDGIYLTSLGVGDGPRDLSYLHTAELRSPTALAVDSKNQVYVLDRELEVIKVYDENAQYMKSIGGPGEAEGKFRQPVDIVIDKNDYLYVADRGNNRVQIFDPKGNLAVAFGSQGEGGGYFQEISALAVSDNLVYVADYQSDKIQVFRYPLEDLRTERFFATQAVLPSETGNGNIVMRYAQAEEQAREEAIKEITEQNVKQQNYIKGFMRVESVEILNDGKVKVSVSVPKEVFRKQSKSYGD